MTLVAVRELLPNGDVTEHIDLEQSTPDRLRLGVPLYFVSHHYRDEVERLTGYVPVELDYARFGAYMAPACWRTYLLQVAVLIAPLRWNALRALWAIGLWEAPHQSLYGTGHFSPFPWRGTHRHGALRG